MISLLHVPRGYATILSTYQVGHSGALLVVILPIYSYLGAMSCPPQLGIAHPPVACAPRATPVATQR